MSSSLNLVSGDDLLIQAECRLTLFPSLCIECIKSDPSYRQADKKGIATIIVKCLINHASTLQSGTSQIASSVLSPTMKVVFQTCATGYGFANQVLNDATRALTNFDAVGALTYVGQARASNTNCQTTSAVYVGVIPKVILSEQILYEQLSNVATSIITAGIRVH
ncbi:hypothetical protein RIF29_30756 [Crotalaria pallida]|uniref:Pectinesterase inhibitor domain-containing protein n=1 Tax=Crotalaria pallida TaxID=3830 RepID=A0AAN9EH92_CROPI